MSITIQREFYTELIEEELKILVSKTFEEAINYGIPFSVDWDTYKVLDKVGMLVFITARDDSNKIVGYIISLVSKSSYSKDTLFAHQDTFFVDKNIRKSLLGVSIKLLRESERVLKEMGVVIVHQNIKNDDNFSPFLDRMGYKFVERVYYKRIN